MDTLITASPENLHHAYYIVGDKSWVLKELISFFEERMGIEISGNPDYFHYTYATLKIEEARELSALQERKNFSNGRKIFVIETDFITEEAQNSLLKVFEEPTRGTHFFVISPQEMLLPTLKSRMQVVLAGMGQIRKEQSVLSMSIADRMSKVKEITEAIADEDATKQDAIAFLNHIESELYEKGVEKYARQLNACQFSRESLYDRGAPIKMILEQLVLSI